MKSNVSSNEIDTLEKVLSDFKSEWEILQIRRAAKWRISFFISFVITVILSLFSSSFWWLALIVIAYFAGSLFTMLRQNAKTSTQIVEHQHQLKLVRLLRKFQASPYSEE